MFTILPSRDTSTVAVEIEGKATGEDARKLNEHIEKHFGEEKKFNVLAVIHELEGTTAKGIMDGIKVDAKRWDQFNKFAVLSDKKSINVSAKAGSYLPGVKAKDFDKDEIESAWNWIQEKN
ncbi:STAS/SEC14 domain-containing protein [Halobacillus massiliensis]|uniref:STAS/SEC14 domain-containing protein n=1 Tax=Halobacillus massiliensis TaxID=1926286 RepID=UPI0009E324E8|nr:STAS/SEC14 domain-containing protein [Halobacillus massiliensis]